MGDGVHLAEWTGELCQHARLSGLKRSRREIES
ncbi:Uncharacterised protein [Chlamydia abortus]|nr:Uncharacterised protein [Chlamydia abortus]